MVASTIPSSSSVMGLASFGTTKVVRRGIGDRGMPVTVERDGKLVRREKTIDVNAGDSVNLRFDFEGESQVASR